MMNITFFTNKGNVRDHNEDAVVFAGNSVSCCSMSNPVMINVESSDRYFVVIDGMGGYHGGEKAASIVASSFTSYSGSWDIPVRTAQDKITQILHKSVQIISETAGENPLYSSMGAALAGIVICSDAVLAFNCGDCRVYRQHGEYLEKLTHDHSVVQELCDKGEIEEDDMRTHERKNVITACVSSKIEDLDIFFRVLPLNAGQRFFVCSDGVWEAMQIDDIERHTTNLSVSEAAESLASFLFTLHENCSDNISFMMIES